MTTLAEKTRVLQNMGVIDRLLRLVLGAAMIGVIYYYSVHAGFKSELMVSSVLAISLYPIFTGMIGWDPFYALVHGRTCSDSGRNQCGSLPYQLKAMFGRAPQFCDSDSERSLESCHDEPEEHPHHKVWRVDVEPVIYPDDKAWHSYFAKKAASDKAKLNKASSEKVRAA